MKEYVFSMLGVVLISGAISMLAPEGSLKPYVTLLASICLITAALGPIGELADRIQNAELALPSGQNDVSDYESVYREALLAGNEASFCELLKIKMMKELDMSSESFGVLADMELTDEGYELKELTVVLRGVGIAQDPEVLRAYTRSLFDLECEIIYE